MRLVLLIPCALAVACDVCRPPDDTALEYANDASWVCRPGATNDACADEFTFVDEEGALDSLPRVNPEGAPACFWIYPTLDLALATDVHTDFEDATTQRTAVTSQAATLTEMCTVHAPLYRQVTLGVYIERDREERDRCFGVAAGDVMRAFTTFLEDIGDDTPFIIGGHSQGGQVTTTIVRDVIEPDAALHARMIAALPIGWGVGVDEDSDVGGTFDITPVCSEREQTGCALSYRSFGAGNDKLRDPRTNGTEAGTFFGDVSVCTNPVDDDAPLSRALFPIDNPFIDFPQATLEAAEENGARFALYRDAFSARCIDVSGDGNVGLEVTPLLDEEENPVDFQRNLFDGASGTHVLDMQLTQGPLADLLAEKIAAFR